MTVRKSKRGNFDIEDIGDIELPEALDDKVRKVTCAAEKELEETRVNFRWQREPLELVKKVAGSMGVPYQTYMKQVLYRQALRDMENIRAYGHGQPAAESAPSVRESS